MNGRFGHRARFIRDAVAQSRPLDRNEKVRVKVRAAALDAATRRKNCHGGVLGKPALAVLEALLYRFQNRATGLCCPSVRTLAEAVDLSERTVARALKRLEAAGVLRIVRRLLRTVVNGRPMVQQTSNLYSMHEPLGDAAERVRSMLRAVLCRRRALVSSGRRQPVLRTVGDALRNAVALASAGFPLGIGSNPGGAQ